MCRLCDACGPVCRWHVDQGWMLRSPPPPRDWRPPPMPLWALKGAGCATEQNKSEAVRALPKPTDGVRRRAEPVKRTQTSGMNRRCPSARPARTLCDSPCLQSCHFPRAPAGHLAVASAPRASPVSWFQHGAFDANEHEMLFFKFLLVL